MDLMPGYLLRMICHRFDLPMPVFRGSKGVNRINNVAYTMQYVIGINIRWTHYDRWSAHNLINNNICNYLLLSLVINSC